MSAWLTARFELARGGDAYNLRAMEGMRGVAVLLVFLVHYASMVQPWIAQQPTLLAFNAVLDVGHAGVDLFFVLSGYLIYGSLMSREQQFLPFMGRRIERIYPTFTVVFLAYVALSFVFPAESKIPPSPGEGALYLLQNYLLLPGLFPIRQMITVAWSLSFEMFYYLAIPAVIALFKLRQRDALWRTAFFGIVALTFASYTAVYDGPGRLLMFISGILLYEAMTHTEWRVSSAAGLAALVIGLASALLVLPLPYAAAATVKTVFLFVAFWLVGLACFRPSRGARQDWLRAAFEWTPLRWLGNMSYSYYLLHFLALKGVFLALSRMLPPTGHEAALYWGLLPLALLVTLISSAVLFLLIERPFSLAPHKPRGARENSRLPQAASASESGS